MENYYTLTFHNDGRPEDERVVLREDFSYEDYEECEINRANETVSTHQSFRYQYPGCYMFWWECMN